MEAILCISTHHFDSLDTGDNASQTTYQKLYTKKKKKEHNRFAIYSVPLLISFLHMVDLKPYKRVKILFIVFFTRNEHILSTGK